MARPPVDQLPPARVLTHLGAMLAVAAVLGVVVAGLAIPFAGVVGIGARNVAAGIDELPEELETGALAQRTRILDAEGNLITTLFDENRVSRPLHQISRSMVEAIVAIEDYRFYQHGALDLKGTLRAFITNQANSGVVQGGSSITQQLVKQTLIDQAQTEEERKAATEESYARKLKELRYAIALEETHTKDWILERYLNTVYFGDGAYGVQAAAQHYFGVNAKNLDVRQSAMLAGLVKNPTAYDPTNSPDRSLERRNVVLDRMAELGVIERSEAEAIKEQDLGLNVQRTQNGCVNSTAPFFCDYVVNWLLADPALGRTKEERETLLKSGGLTIRTTLSRGDQKATDAAVAEHVFPTDNAIGGLALVETGTGNVLALSQSRPMGRNKQAGETFLNYVVPQEYGDSAGFQAGSTFKAFTLATAISQGIPLTTTINSPEQMKFDLSDFANCEGEPGFVGEWEVGNSTTSGNKNLYTGTRESVNTFFVQLIQRTGVCDPFNLAVSMGVKLTAPEGDGQGNGLERTPSFTLGVVNVSPLEMAEAYATFGARGLHCASRPVTEILDAAGNVVKKYDPQCTQVMPQAVADAVNDVLRGVNEPGGFGYDIGQTYLTNARGQRVPSAGKTGTTQDGKSVWFVGYSPQVAAAAMIAGANEFGQPIPLVGQPVGGAVRNVSGSGFAGPMWSDAMHIVDDRLEPIEFVRPDPTQIQGVLVDIPNVRGMSVESATAAITGAGFTLVNGGFRPDSVRAGRVAYTWPSSQAAQGSSVTIYVSSGPERKGRGGKNRGREIVAPQPEPEPEPEPEAPWEQNDDENGGNGWGDRDDWEPGDGNPWGR